MAAAPLRNNSRSLPKLHAFDNRVAFPSCTQSTADHPREQSRAIFCNRIAFPYDALRMLAW